MTTKIYPTASPLDLELDATMRGKDGSLYCVKEGKRGKYWKLAPQEAENDAELYADFVQKTAIKNPYVVDHQSYCDRFMESMYDAMFNYSENKLAIIERLYEFQLRHTEHCTCITSAVMGCPYCLTSHKLKILAGYVRINGSHVPFKILAAMCLDIEIGDTHVFGNYMGGDFSKYIVLVSERVTRCELSKGVQNSIMKCLLENYGSSLSEDAIIHIYHNTPLPL